MEPGYSPTRSKDLTTKNLAVGGKTKRTPLEWSLKKITVGGWAWRWSWSGQLTRSYSSAWNISKRKDLRGGVLLARKNTRTRYYSSEKPHNKQLFSQAISKPYIPIRAFKNRLIRPNRVCDFSVYIAQAFSKNNACANWNWKVGNWKMAQS